MGNSVTAVEVTYSVEGCVKTDKYTCDGARVQMLDHCANIVLRNGKDEQGAPVLDVIYRTAHRIIRRC